MSQFFAPKYWSFSFSISPSNEHPGLISFRMDWLDLLAVQGTLKSLLQHHSSKVPSLWCSVSLSSLVAQTVKRLPTMWEIWVQSLGREDPLEKEMATHSSIVAWRIHGLRSLVGYTVHGVAKSQTQLRD